MGATSKFEVRIKKFGRIISRHVDATGKDQAATKCEGKGIIILGVRKVDAQDVIGRVDTFRLVKEVVGKAPPQINGNGDKGFKFINNDTTVDSLLFVKRKDKNDGSEKYKNKYKKIDNRIVRDELE